MLLTKNTFNQEVLETKDIVLVDFYADWCAPCRMLAPIIEDLSKELEGTVKVFKVNVDKDEALAEEYEVFTIPTLIVFKNGKEISREVNPRNKQKIMNMFEK